MRTHETNSRLPFIPEGVQVTSLQNESKANEKPYEVLVDENISAKEFINLDENFQDIEDEDFLEMSTVGDGGYGWIIVLCSFCCLSFVDGFGTSYNLLLNPKCSRNTSCIGYSDLSTDFGISSRTLMFLPHGLILGLNLLVGPFVSALSSVIPFRYVTMFGAFLVTISCYFASVSSNFYIFIAMTVLIGIGSGFIYLPAIAIVGQWFQTKRSLAVGISLCGVGVGEIIGGLLMTRLTESYGWRFALFIISCCASQLIIVSALFRPIEIHGVIENVQSIKRREEADKRKLYLEEKARKLELAREKKLAKKKLKESQDEERIALRRAQAEQMATRKNFSNRGTIMQKIIEEKNRQRTTSVGSLDGMFINQDNELIANLNPEKNLNLISKISESALLSLESRFGVNRHNAANEVSGGNPGQEVHASRVLINALNSENKLISIHVPDEPIPMKVPLDKLVQEYVQSQYMQQANKNNHVLSQQSFDKNSSENKKIQQEQDSTRQSALSEDTVDEIRNTDGNDLMIDTEVHVKEPSHKSSSLANSLSDLNTPVASSPGLPEEIHEDGIQLDSNFITTGKSITAMAAEQVLDPETKATIKTQIFQEMNNNAEIESEGLTRSILGQLHSSKDNEKLIESLLNYKINNAIDTSNKSSKSQKSQLQSSLIVSISTGMAGAPCPTKIINKVRYATIDIADDVSSKCTHENSDNNQKLGEHLEENDNNGIMEGGLIIHSTMNQFGSDPASINYASSEHRIQESSRVNFLFLFLQDILNPRIFKSLKFILLILSSFFGIFGFVLPIFIIPDFVNIHPSLSSNGNNVAGYILCTIGFCNCIGRLLATAYIEKFNSHLSSINVNTVSLLMCALATAIMPLFAFNYILVLCSFIIFGIFTSVFMSLKNILVVELIGYEKLTNAFGFLLLFQGFSIILASALCGLIIDWLSGQLDSIRIISELQTIFIWKEIVPYTNESFLVSPPSVIFFIAAFVFLLASISSISLYRLYEPFAKQRNDIENLIKKDSCSQDTLRNSSEKDNTLHKHEELDPVEEEEEQ